MARGIYGGCNFSDTFSAIINVNKEQRAENSVVVMSVTCYSNPPSPLCAVHQASDMPAVMMVSTVISECPTFQKCGQDMKLFSGGAPNERYPCLAYAMCYGEKGSDQ